MSDLLFPTFGINEENVNKIVDIYSRLIPAYTAEFDHDFSFNFKEFEAFRFNESIHVGPAILLKNGVSSSHLCFIKISYTVFSRYGSHVSEEYQAWGVTSLRTDFGHILIKPETFLDKIHEWIHPVEVEFEDDKEFSRTFYVVTNDELKTILKLNATFRKYVSQISEKEFIIEIIGNRMIIGNKKIINAESALDFAAFLNKISTYF